MSRWSIARSLLAALGIFLLTTSTASAATWTRLSNAPIVDWWGSMGVSSDGTHLIAGATGNYLYTSSDGGETWVQRTGAGTHQWISTAMSPDGATQFATAWPSGVYRSVDGGETWNSVAAFANSPAATVSNFSSDGTRLALYHAKWNFAGYIYTSTDSGATWATSTAAGARHWGDITTDASGMIIYAADGEDPAVNSYIYKSTDGGATWTALTSAGSQTWGNVTTSADGQIVYAAEGRSVDSITATGRVWKSVDGGATWGPTSAPVSGYYMSRGSLITSNDGSVVIVSPENPATGYLGEVYLSTDAGTTWTRQLQSETAQSYGSYFGMTPDGSVIYATSEGGAVNLQGSIYRLILPRAVSAPSQPPSNGPIAGSIGTGFYGPGYAAPRPQVRYPDGRIEYLDTASTTPPAATSTTFRFTRNLSFGMRGADVKQLQLRLSVNATGYFGTKTKAALAAWQKAHGITPASGIFGPKTRATMSL